MHTPPLSLQKSYSNDVQHCHRPFATSRPYLGRSLIRDLAWRRLHTGHSLQHTGARTVHFPFGQIPLADPKVSFEGRGIIVTAAKTGLGFEVHPQRSRHDGGKTTPSPRSRHVHEGRITSKYGSSTWNTCDKHLKTLQCVRRLLTISTWL